MACTGNVHTAGARAYVVMLCTEGHRAPRAGRQGEESTWIRAGGPAGWLLTISACAASGELQASGGMTTQSAAASFLPCFRLGTRTAAPSRVDVVGTTCMRAGRDARLLAQGRARRAHAA